MLIKVKFVVTVINFSEFSSPWIAVLHAVGAQCVIPNILVAPSEVFKFSSTFSAYVWDFVSVKYYLDVRALAGFYLRF